MITGFEKKAVAWMLTAVLCLTMAFSGSETVYADESENVAAEQQQLTEGGENQETALGETSDIKDPVGTGEKSETTTQETTISDIKDQAEDDVKDEDENETDTKKEDRAGSSVTDGEFEYTIQGDTAVITKYTGNDPTVQIPGTIGDDKEVVSVGENAFEGNQTLTSVTIPASVTSLQYQSFASCTNLQTVTLNAGSQLKSIGEGAFWKSGLTELTCLTVEEVGVRAFGFCDALKTVTFGTPLASLGSEAFHYSGIETVNIPTDARLTRIESSTFCDTKNLKNITLPNKIVSIGENAFRYSGLVEIEIPDSVTSIGDYAFAWCKSLKKAKIGNNVAYISLRAFLDCGLTQVTIGDNTQGIEHYALQGNKELSELTIPGNVTRIEYGAFRDCSSLANITFPDSLKRISASVLEDTAWYKSQADGVVYAGKVLYRYKGNMPAGTSVTVKDGTAGIAVYAFGDCVNLKEVNIPDSVTNIGEFAFYNSAGMSSVTVPSSVTEIGQMALGYMAGTEGDGTWFTSDDTLTAMSGTCKKIPDFTIRGAAGSAAQTYAAENGFEFVAINEQTGKDLVDDKTSQDVAIDTGELDWNKICENFNVNINSNIEISLSQSEPTTESLDKLIPNVANGYSIKASYEILMSLNAAGKQIANLTEDFGRIKLTFKVDASLAGQKAIVYQLHNNSQVITHDGLTVNTDGTVTITVDKLSAFAVATQESSDGTTKPGTNQTSKPGANQASRPGANQTSQTEINKTNTNNTVVTTSGISQNSPKTGDGANPVFRMIVAIASFMAVILVRKSYHKN